jgi:beta-galactosidase
MRDNDWLAGEFRWTGIDYLGEAGNFPSRFKNFGIIDMCGYPKDTYYLYQSVWTDKNILHILPHWNWPGMEGVKIPVWVYANNCDQVELFLNDTSLGKKDFNTKELYCSWLVEYVPGVLKAVATQNGKVVNTKLMPTAGDAAKIELQIDTDKISANHEDVVHAEVRILDDAGNFVPDADNRVTFDVIGPARIIGVDNGDPIDHDPLKANSRKAFNGMCLAIIQSNLTGGKVSITAKSKGLTPVSASFSIVKDPSASKLHKSIVDRKITYEISDHERRLGIIEEIKAIPEEGPTSNPKDLSKEEKIKLREARKANRNNKTN